MPETSLVKFLENVLIFRVALLLLDRTADFHSIYKRMMSDLTLASDFLFEVLYFVSVLFSFAWCALWSLEKLASMSSAVSFTDPLFLGMGTRGRKRKKKPKEKKNEIWSCFSCYVAFRCPIFEQGVHFFSMCLPDFVTIYEDMF